MLAAPGDIARIDAPGQEPLPPAPRRLRLDITAGASVPVTVFFRDPPPSAASSFYQVAGKLVLPLSENREMTRQDDGFQVVLETPASDVPLRYLLRVKAPQAERPTDIDVFAYPGNLPERLRRLSGALSRNGQAIGLFGPGSTVRALLTAWQVPFVEGGSSGRGAPVAVGDFIGHELDGEKLPESGAPRTLFLTTSPQADASGEATRSEVAESRKTVLASGESWGLLPSSPALQYRFFTLLSQTLPPSSP